MPLDVEEEISKLLALSVKIHSFKEPTVLDIFLEVIKARHIGWISKTKELREETVE